MLIFMKKNLVLYLMLWLLFGCIFLSRPYLTKILGHGYQTHDQAIHMCNDSLRFWKWPALFGFKLIVSEVLNLSRHWHFEVWAILFLHLNAVIKKRKRKSWNISQDSEDLAYKWFNTMRHQSLPLFIINPHSSMHGNLNEAGTQEQSTSLMRPICKASVSRIMPSVDHSSRSDWCGALGLIIVKGPQ